MKTRVKLFGSTVADYEKTFEKWLAENEDIEIKNIAVALNQTGEWILTVILFENQRLLNE